MRARIARWLVTLATLLLRGARPEARTSYNAWAAYELERLASLARLDGINVTSVCRITGDEDELRVRWKRS